MVILHTALVTRRLHEGDDSAKVLGQAVFDIFCTDMDRSMRELGVGDMAVPKKMRRLGEAFYGRAAAYDAGLADASSDGLAKAIGRNVFSEDEVGEGARALAGYVVDAAAKLGGTPLTAFAEAALLFPDPDTYMAVAST